MSKDKNGTGWSRRLWGRGITGRSSGVGIMGPRDGEEAKPQRKYAAPQFVLAEDVAPGSGAPFVWIRCECGIDIECSTKDGHHYEVERKSGLEHLCTFEKDYTIREKRKNNAMGEKNSTKVA